MPFSINGCCVFLCNEKRSFMEGSLWEIFDSVHASFVHITAAKSKED